MKFTLALALVAAVAVQVEAIAIPADTTSSLGSELAKPTKKRKGCGRPPSNSTVLAYSQSTFSSSSEMASTSLASYTSSSAISSTTPIVTISTVTTSSESTSETTSSIPTETSESATLSTDSTSVTFTVSTDSSTEASTTVSETDSTPEASTTVSSTISTTDSATETSTTEASTTESTTEASTTISSTISTTESVTEAPTTSSSTASATESTTTETTATSSTTAPACSATNAVADGGFEEGDSSTWTKGTLAYIESNTNNAYQTPYGSWFTVLYGQRSTTASISQALTSVGSSSTLSFSYRLYGRLNYPTSTCTATVTYAGTTLYTTAFAANSAALTTASRGWQTVSVPVGDLAASGTLAFGWTCSSMTTDSLDFTLDEVYLNNVC